MVNLSISLNKGRGNLEHNKRKLSYVLSNVDRKKSSSNIVLVDEDLHKTYTQLFDSAVEDHDKKEKKKSRRIVDYYEYSKKLKTNKGQPKELFREFVVQFGNRKTLDEYKINDEVLIKMYKKFIESFIKNNPNLHLFGAYIHLDEKTPHLHLDVVPCSKSSSKRSKMSLTNSFDNALLAQGYDVKNQRTAFKNWRNDQVEIAENVMKEFNITRDVVGNTNTHSTNARLDLEQKYTTQVNNFVLDQNKKFIELKEKLKPFKAKIKTGFAKSEEVEVVKSSVVNELIKEKTALQLQNQMQKNSLINIKKQNDSFAKRDLNSDATRYKELYDDALIQIDDLSNELNKSLVKIKHLQQLNDSLNATIDSKDIEINNLKITLCDMDYYIQRNKSSHASSYADAKRTYGDHIFNDKELDLINNVIEDIYEKGE